MEGVGLASGVPLVIWFVVVGIAVVASTLWLVWLSSFIDAPSNDPISWLRALVEWAANGLAWVALFVFVVPGAGVFAAWLVKDTVSWHWRVFIGVCGSCLALFAIVEVGRVSEQEARLGHERDLRYSCESDEELSALTDLLERARSLRHRRLRDRSAPRILQWNEARSWEQRREHERSANAQTPSVSREDETEGKS